jgi:hypothetical protein
LLHDSADAQFAIRLQERCAWEAYGQHAGNKLDFSTRFDQKNIQQNQCAVFDQLSS